jgi:phosphoglycerate dehydrogenase-like enzyme
MQFQKILTIGINESALDPEYWKKIESLAVKKISLSVDSSEIKQQIVDADCLLVNPFVYKVEKDLLDAAPRLKYIGAISTAFGKVDVDYATKKGIIVCNIPGYSTEAVSEFAFGVILGYIRDLENERQMAKESNFSATPPIPISEIKDKKFGVIGLGRIGSRVAELALAFGASVVYWSRNRKKEFEEKGIKYEELDKLLSECDFISLHLAFNSDTENFINKSRIERIKPGSILINLAPNELVDFNALENRLAKNGLVYIADHSDEMTPEQVKLISKHKNCILYPPLAYATKEARMLKQKIFVENIENFLKGKPSNKVN